MPDTQLLEQLRLARKLAMALEARDAADALVSHYRQRLLGALDGSGDPDNELGMLHSVEKLRVVVEDNE